MIKLDADRGALISSCKQYRYALWRRVDCGDKIVTFIGLNPSTADATEDDPTIRRCMSYVSDWGYDTLLMVNLFAYRATLPAVMKLAIDPIGPRNNETLRFAANLSTIVIAAWGTDGNFMRRDAGVKSLLRGRLHALHVTKDGHPGHPLYLKGNLRPFEWA